MNSTSTGRSLKRILIRIAGAFLILSLTAAAVLGLKSYRGSFSTNVDKIIGDDELLNHAIKIRAKQATHDESEDGSGEEEELEENPPARTNVTAANATESHDNSIDHSDLTLEELTKKLSTLKASKLDYSPTATKQFAHLHHMKTGGTSLNRLLSCALKRARGGGSRDRVLRDASIEECSSFRYNKCIHDEEDPCREKIQSAAYMQYCAPMHQMQVFDWLDDTDIVTVIRHPVDRVWSMYRFQTRGCYKCLPLTDIYAAMENRTAGDEDFGISANCQAQLVNHQTRNLLTDTFDEDKDIPTRNDQLQEALYNLKNKLAMVGITNELPLFAKQLGKAFPWLAEELGDDGARYLRKNDDSSTVCALAHANASPSNNRCGPGKTHMPLPDQPDEATRKIILKHNMLDLKIYEAAVKRFNMQSQALGLSQDTEP